jgi:hypothetical protein
MTEDNWQPWHALTQNPEVNDGEHAFGSEQWTEEARFDLEDDTDPYVVVYRELCASLGDDVWLQYRHKRKPGEEEGDTAYAETAALQEYHLTMMDTAMTLVDKLRDEGMIETTED